MHSLSKPFRKFRKRAGVDLGRYNSFSMSQLSQIFVRKPVNGKPLQHIYMHFGTHCVAHKSLGLSRRLS
jgi:hypothetical protein